MLSKGSRSGLRWLLPCSKGKGFGSCDAAVSQLEPPVERPRHVRGLSPVCLQMDFAKKEHKAWHKGSCHLATCMRSQSYDVCRSLHHLPHSFDWLDTKKGYKLIRSFHACGSGTVLNFLNCQFHLLKGANDKSTWKKHGGTCIASMGASVPG